MRRRSFIRGLFAGIGVKVLCTALIVVVLATLVRLFSITLSVPSPTQDGPFPSTSLQWFATQVLVLGGAVLAGYACAHWSEPKSWAAPAMLALLWLLWSVAKLPEAQPVIVMMVRVAISSVGILLGAFLYQRRHVEA